MNITTSLIVLIAVFLFSCNYTESQQNANKKFIKVNFQGEAQGTYYSITYFDEQGRNLQSSIDSLLKAFDLSASNYNPNSVICKINRNEDIKPDSIFLGNFLLAQRVSQESDGMFDITVRPLVELWGFGLKNREHVTDKQIQEILPHIGYQKVRYEDGKIIKEDTAIKLDFNAIAQGYSVDVVGKFLQSKGITHYLVDIGGEVYANSTKPDGNKWSVGIEQPKDNADYGDGLNAVLEISNIAMATSGNYRKFYVENGIRYSHTINPKTGYPVKDSLLSATILASTTGEADAYATVMMVLGLEGAKDFLAKHPELEAYLIYSDCKGNYQIFETKGIKSFVKEQ